MTELQRFQGVKECFAHSIVIMPNLIFAIPPFEGLYKKPQVGEFRGLRKSIRQAFPLTSFGLGKGKQAASTPVKAPPVFSSFCSAVPVY